MFNTRTFPSNISNINQPSIKQNTQDTLIEIFLQHYLTSRKAQFYYRIYFFTNLINWECMYSKILADSKQSDGDFNAVKEKSHGRARGGVL